RLMQDDDIVVTLSAASAATGAFTAAATAGDAAALLAALRGFGDVPLEHVGEALGVRIAQVDDLRVAAGFQRRVEMRDQAAHAHAFRLVAADEHAVGAVIRDQRGGPAAAFRGARLRPRRGAAAAVPRGDERP